MFLEHIFKNNKGKQNCMQEICNSFQNGIITCETFVFVLLYMCLCVSLFFLRLVIYLISVNFQQCRRRQTSAIPLAEERKSPRKHKDKSIRVTISRRLPVSGFQRFVYIYINQGSLGLFRILTVITFKYRHAVMKAANGGDK